MPCRGYRVSYFKEPVNIPYPDDPDAPGARPEGCSFQHGRFIQNLRQAATSTPNVTVVEAKATDLLRDEDTGKVIGVLASSAGDSKKTTEVSRTSLFRSIANTQCPLTLTWRYLVLRQPDHYL